MSDDPTEGVRRILAAGINAVPGSREALEKVHGQVWDVVQLSVDFEVVDFVAPFVIVRRLSDGAEGCLMFQHRPRFYWDFKAV